MWDEKEELGREEGGKLRPGCKINKSIFKKHRRVSTLRAHIFSFPCIDVQGTSFLHGRKAVPPSVDSHSLVGHRPIEARIVWLSPPVI